MERDTPQRRVIRRVLTQAGRPMSPEEIHVSGRQVVRSLGIATVYRNLRSMADAGWLSPVELPGEPTRYEMSGKPHHHHFLCRSCARAFEVEGCEGVLPAQLPQGFEVHEHEVVLYGKCDRCA